MHENRRRGVFVLIDNASDFVAIVAALSCFAAFLNSASGNWVNFLAYAVALVAQMLMVCTRHCTFFRERRVTTTRINWPRIWSLLRFSFSREIKERIFDPAVGELMEDYVQASRFRTTAARRWLTFCFAIRTVLLVLDCLRVVAMSRTVQFVWRLTPEPIRRWFM